MTIFSSWVCLNRHKKQNKKQKKQQQTKQKKKLWVIIFIIFYDFLIFYQIFLPLQAKQCTIITYKYGMILRVAILGN